MLRDFLKERRLVYHSGRRFIVRKPSCETVTLALLHFGPIVLALRGAYLKKPESFADPMAACLPHFSNPRAMAAVLSSCVELHGGAPGDLEELISSDRSLRGALVRAIAEISDLGRIVRLIDLDTVALKALEEEQPGPEPQDDPGLSGPSPMELLAAGLAERFHCSPFDVMGWPYEAVLSLSVDILPALDPAPSEGEKIYGLSRREWAEKGVDLAGMN